MLFVYTVFISIMQGAYGGFFLHFLMTNKTRRIFWSNTLKQYLCFSWVLGLVLGIALGKYTTDDILELVFFSLMDRASVAGVLLSGLLPLTLSFVFLCFSLPQFLLPLVFVKAYGFGFSLCCTSVVFGSAAWLMCAIGLFSDFCGTTILLWFLFYHQDLNHKKLDKRFFLCCVLLIALAVLEYFVISPYLAIL